MCARLAVEPRNHQGDGPVRHLLVQDLPDSPGQWFGKIGVAQCVLAVRHRGDSERLLVFEHRRHVKFGDINRFGAGNVPSHTEKTWARQFFRAPGEPFADNRQIAWLCVDVQLLRLNRPSDDHPRTDDLNFASGRRFHIEEIRGVAKKILGIGGGVFDLNQKVGLINRRG
ncbi:hypothetical protein D3C71_1667670 [compost metagenome]